MISHSVFWEKVRRLFSVFILWPEMEQKWSSVSRTEKAIFSSTLPNKSRSSANKRWEMGTFSGPTQKGVHSFSSQAWEILEDKASKQILNKYGDNGSPCLSHLVWVKEVVFRPLMSMEEEVCVIHSMIMVMVCVSRPMVMRHSLTNPHSNRS